MTYLLFALFIIFLLFVYPQSFGYVENLTNSKTTNGKNNCDCSLIQSISTLTTEYSSLNSRVNKLEDSVKDINSITIKNRSDLKRINGLIKQLEDAMKE